jgi:hypothetical protein
LVTRGEDGVGVIDEDMHAADGNRHEHDARRVRTRMLLEN